jgi:peptidylprolyl isomerase
MTSRFTAMMTMLLVLFALPGCAPHKPKIQITPVPASSSALVDMDPSHDPDDVLYLDLSDGGRVTIRLMPKWAPNHVERIKTLTRQGFYDGIIFHRVIDGFMAQTGDPTGTGQGGSKLPDLKAEFNDVPHLRGILSMARTDDPDSANSQFFIVFYPRFALDHKYTVFGRVIGGMEWVDRIARGEPPTNPTKILQASLETQNKASPAFPPPAPVPAPASPLSALPSAVPTPASSASPTPVPADNTPSPTTEQHHRRHSGAPQ